MGEPFPAYDEHYPRTTTNQHPEPTPSIDSTGPPHSTSIDTPDSDIWMSDFVDLSSAPSRPASQRGTTSMSTSTTSRTHSPLTNTALSRPISPDPFLGASEPLENPDSSTPTPHYTNETFTELEDETLLLFRKQHPFSSWDQLHTKWLHAFCAPYNPVLAFPTRELSALLARWKMLNWRAGLTPRDCMIIWIHRNATVATSYSKLDAAFSRANKCVGEEVLAEAERSWGRRLGIEGWGYKALKDESVEFGLDGSGTDEDLDVLRNEWWQTMQGQREREMEIVWRRWNDDWELWQICESYAQKGFRWDEERVRGMVEEEGWEEGRRLILETL